MPNHVVLVRHGESEGNLVRSAYKHGDDSYLTDAFRERPGHEWRLTSKGVEQANAAGAWIQEHVLAANDLAAFGIYNYSPHRRCRETAGHLGLPGAKWRLNRLLREREWGELQGMVEAEHKEQYPLNFALMKADPLHWAPPGGESVSQVADNRVREVFDTLHREEANGLESYIGVTHGEWIWASSLVLDYMFNEEYEASEHDPAKKINNCQVIHRTKIDPVTGEQADYLRYVRSVWPWKNPDDPGEWHTVGRKELSNEELLAQVEQLPRLFDE